MTGTANAGYENEKSGGGGGYLGVDNSDVNSHTYVYDPDKSLRKMIVDTLPNSENYQDLNNIAENRPTLDELMLDKMAEREAKEEVVDTRKGKVIKFGWIEGVLMRCLLNIWGTMLFLRLTWVVGQAGLWQGLLVITLCNVVTVLSALSMSAISTNGQIAAGGVYYMISRALGPAIGGSIGLMFTVANTISVGTYTVGFSTSFLDLMQDAAPGWDGIVDNGCRQAGCRDNDIRIIGGPTLCLFLVITFLGMDWVTRVQKFLLGLLILAQCDMFIGSFLDLESFGTCYVQKDTEGKVGFMTHDQRHAYGYTGWSLDTIKTNINPDYQPSSVSATPGFMENFGVFFTAVTGIVAGANLSGDLKDPSMAIPKGTLLAILGTYITYMYFGIQTSFVFNKRASGIAEEFRFNKGKGDFIDSNGVPLLTDPYYNTTEDYPAMQYIIFPPHVDCSEGAAKYRDYLKFIALPEIDRQYALLNVSTKYALIYDKWNTKEDAGYNPEIGGPGSGECMFGSAHNQMTMTYISFTGWLRYLGGFSASLSSAIASMVGAPRILQAVGKDGIYPGVFWFAKGFNANNDPWRGYILVFVVAMGFVMVAKLNAIGVIASNFFLAAYALMNLSCFHSDYTNAPNWRPSFKYYNKWVALTSAILCVVLMFLMDWRYAAGTIGCQLLLGLFIYYRKPDANWGSSADALTFINAMKSTQELTDAPDHIKNYRPKVLVLTGNPAHRPSLVDFANIITKKMSLLVCGHVLTEEGPVNLANLKNGMQQWLKDHQISGYYSVTQNKSLNVGAKSVMTISGLGKLSPNMVLLGFKNNWRADLSGLEDYIEVMYNAFDLNMSFAMLRTQEGFDFSGSIGSEQQIIREVPIKASDLEADGEGPSNSLATPEPQGRKTRKISTAVYRGTDGNVLDIKTTDKIQQFQQKKRTGTIDVWWLYDDGGLTLLIPHIIKTRKQFKDCKLRVFTLANKSNELDMETRNLASMLSKFRIDYETVSAVPDVTKKADASTKAEFDAMIEGCNIPEQHLQDEREKTNRHLRLTEMLRQNSANSELIVMTLPLPKRGHTSSALYTAWLDMMTKGMPPTLLIRGNQQSVLTFYS